MGHTHTQKKQFIDKEIYQKLSYCSDVLGETYPPPSPLPNNLPLLPPFPPPPFPIIKHCTIDKYWIENHDSQSMQFSVHTFGVPYYLFNKYSLKMASNPIRDHAATHGKNSNNRVGEAIYIYIYIYNIYLLQSRCNNNVRYFQSH